MNHRLYTYENAKECRSAIRKFEEEGLERLPMGTNFSEMGCLLSDSSDCFVDMTGCFSWLESNRFGLLGVEDMLDNANDNVKFISRESQAKFALESLPYYFTELIPIFPKQRGTVDSSALRRKPLYVYELRREYDALVRKAEKDQSFRLVTFAWVRDNTELLVDIVSNSDNRVLIDLTSFAAFNNAGLLVAFESIDAIMPASIDYCINKGSADRIYEIYPSIFESIRRVTEIYPELDLGKVEGDESPLSYCDLAAELRASFVKSFCEALTGHSKFKEEFSRLLGSFAVANRLHDQRVFSLFLFGESGVGKTEVARLLNSLLCSGSRLAKINFESYSSQDSLNSLIGSPAGYVGCEGGELNDKLGKSKAKILLCDEFDKTSRDVQNFFLELLEDGFYTDRMGIEHDLDGYIIVFTSNIRSENELNEKIPPELRTRFDMIFEFVEPSIKEKADHVKKIAASKARRYEQELGLSKSIDVSSIILEKEELENLSLREINRFVGAKVANLAISLLDEQRIID